MNMELLNYQFSLIGKFDTIYNDINGFSNIFPDYSKKEIQRDIMPNGNVINCYILSNDTKSIVVHLNRIDFSFRNNPINQEVDIQEFNIFFTKICSHIDNIDRIAINYNCFINDSNSTYSNKLSHCFSIFGNSNNSFEFSVRENNVFEANNLKFNNILTIQKGILQKNDSFESLNALIFLFDINSAEINQNSSDFIKQTSLLNNFSKMYEKLLERLNDVEKFWEGI